MHQGNPDDGPAAAGGPDDARDAVGAVARLRSAVAEVVGASWWQLPDAGLRDAVAEVFAAVGQVQAGYLRGLLELDSRPGAAEGTKPGAGGRAFAVHRLNRNPWQASADMHAARALTPDADPGAGGLPRLGAALAAGEVSREHAHVAVQAVKRVPKHLLAELLTDQEAAAAGLSREPGKRELCRGDVLDELITDHAKRCSPGVIDRLGVYLQNAADPGGERSFDPDATQRRSLTLVTDLTGMLIIRGQLDPAAGELLKAVLGARPASRRTSTSRTRPGRRRPATSSPSRANLSRARLSRAKLSVLSRRCRLRSDQRAGTRRGRGVRSSRPGGSFRPGCWNCWPVTPSCRRHCWPRTARCWIWGGTPARSAPHSGGP